ncbi:MAG: M48 family metalloprotease [Bacilli bacterium]
MIDGSKRSSHSNAYFTSFGKFRRIVLFDTLIEQLDTPEVEAVLAHEIGHYKKGHIVKIMAMSFAMTFLTFAIMGYLSNSEWFYLGFGFCEASAFGLIDVFALCGRVHVLAYAYFQYFSRKNEYEADKFAASICGGSESLCKPLRNPQENLGNLTPHPLYSAFYYSIPRFLSAKKRF